MAHRRTYAALFPAARVHDHWAIYDFAGRWDDVEAEGRELAPSVRLLRTPGHSAEDISTAVGTPDGIVVFRHATILDTRSGEGLSIDQAEAIVEGQAEVSRHFGELRARWSTRIRRNRCS